jgi:hypothetical protein
MEGLEPPHLTASDPKSDVSTNFTTSGGKFQKDKFQIPFLGSQSEFGILDLLFSNWGCKCSRFQSEKAAVFK